MQVRVLGEDAIDLNDHVAHVLGRRAASQQSREGDIPDRGLLPEDEIIGRFKLPIGVVGVGRLADGRDQAVRGACAEGEGRRLEAELQLLAVEVATPGSATDLPGRGKRTLHDAGPCRKKHAKPPNRRGSKK